MIGYKIYTDGGYSLSKGIGAYAFIILEGMEEICRNAERIEKSTNNRCELLAIINAVRLLPDHCSATIYTDSQYCIGVLTGQYRRKKNTDILDEWDIIVASKNLNIEFEWVKGHSGNKYNELCDELCNEAAECDLNDYNLYFCKK